MATIVPRSCLALLLWSLPGVYAITSDMQGALDKHNVYRCMHGVPLLTWDDAIATNAQAWATNGSLRTLRKFLKGCGRRAAW